MKNFDCFDLFYKSPFGACKAFEEVTMRIAITSDKFVTEPTLFITEINNGGSLRAYPMDYEKEENGYNIFKVVFSIPKESVYFYFFRLKIDGVVNEIKRADNHDAVMNYGHLFQLTVCSKEFKCDDNYKGGIMYQIFPDSFHRSGSLKEGIPEDRILRDDWGNVRYYLPNHEGRITNNDYFGGDIKGVTLKLDYLKELSVTAIYMNPIFEAHSNHRYDTADYLSIDPLLGTEEDFKELCYEAKKRGIVVILDGVFSHTGSDSKYFNKEGRYATVGAYNTSESPFKNWYKFINHPNVYNSWWGFDTLPELNKENEEYVNFVCSENGVIHKWIEAGAYGFRLDVADELPPSFLVKIKQAVKKFGGKILIGEVWEDATTKEAYGQHRKYLLGEQLDSTMNYPFREAVLNYIRYGCSCEFYKTIMGVINNYPKESLNTLMNMLSTHDTERAMSKLVAEEVCGRDRYWQAEKNTLEEKDYAKGKRQLMLSTAIQYFLPGVPCIYYGDEAGLYGYKDPFNRGCYPWGKEDKDLLLFFKEIGKIRKNNPVLKEGYFRFIYVNEDVCIFERFDEKDSLLIVVNRASVNVCIDEYVLNIKEYESAGVLGTYEDYTLSSYGAIALKKSNS